MTVELRALLMCEMAFREARNGNWHLIGIHDQVVVRSLPATHAPFIVYWNVASFHGDATVMATLRDPDGAVVQAVRAQMPALPVESFEFAFPMPPLTLQRAGDHTLEFQVGDELLGLRSFRVELVEGPTEG